MTAAATISPAADIAARLDLLTDYRRKREYGAVPITAIGQIRDSFARTLARDVIDTGEISAYLAAGFAAADVHYESVWTRWQKNGPNYWRDGKLRVAS